MGSDSIEFENQWSLTPLIRYRLAFANSRLSTVIISPRRS